MGARGLWGEGLPGSGVVLFEETGVCADRDDVILRLSHLGDAAERSVDTERDKEGGGGGNELPSSLLFFFSEEASV